MIENSNHFQLTKHFNLREFEQHTDGVVRVHPLLVDALQKLRDLIGAPITITSGYRSPTHNAAVGGVRTSKHILGAAADVTVDRVHWHNLVSLAQDDPHLDVLDEGDHIHLSLTDHPVFAVEDPAARRAADEEAAASMAATQRRPDMP